MDTSLQSSPVARSLKSRALRRVSRGRYRWGKISGNIRGIVWIALAGALYTVMVALIKVLGQNLSVFQILWLRQLVMLACILPAIYQGLPGSLVSKRLDWQLVRVTGAMCAMLLSFSAFIHLPLADATTISFVKPFFVTIFAVLFLGEAVGIRRWMAIVVGFLGVAVVMKPSGTDALTVYGFMLLGGAAIAGLVMVAVRKLTKVDSLATIMIYQSAGIGLAMAPFAIYYWQTPTLNEIWLLLACGLIAFVMQFSTVLAYRAGEASVVASVDYLRLIYAVVIGYIFFFDWPDLRVWIGASIIIAALIYTIHREQQVKQQLASAPEGRGTMN